MGNVVSTPWGPSQSARAFGDRGLVFYGTASHGGFFLPPALRAELPAWARDTNGDSQSFRAQRVAGWYEEDCDAAIVVLAFPQWFERTAIENATDCLRGWHEVMSARRDAATVGGPLWKRTVPAPLAALRHHVTGAIERGEATPIVEVPAPSCPCARHGGTCGRPATARGACEDCAERCDPPSPCATYPDIDTTSERRASWKDVGTVVPADGCDRE